MWPSALRFLALVLLLLASTSAFAQTRAWLDRDRIALGETVTLNIETGEAGTPDYAPLRPDFEISGRSSSRRVELGTGGMTRRTLYAVALKPLREGVLTIPALDVGNASTPPLSLVVTPGAAPRPSRAGDEVFVESEADDADPYVQQTVGWVVRLYSAVPLVSGQLDQPAPDGATLRQVGEDAQYTRQIDGRHHTVIERRYLLIPERSGPVTVPGAVFEGRGAAGFFDDLLGRRGELRAQAPPRTLQVQPVPDGAPQPWLPLHDLQLRYRTTPQELQAGRAATLTIEAVADGASAAQMPALELPPIDGVQVFAEPVQADERFVDGRPRATLTRSFSLVPTGPGTVHLAGLKLDWWDVRADRARTATLPPLEWQVTGDAAPPPAAAQPGAPPEGAAPEQAAESAIAPVDADRRGWIIAALLFAALWLFTLVWALQRRSGGDAAEPANPRVPGPPARDPKAGRREFERALKAGDLGEVAEALLAQAHPPAPDIEALRNRLADPAQVAALDALQRARWAGADASAARLQLREAFSGGPRWHAAPPLDAPLLPALYPPKEHGSGTT